MYIMLLPFLKFLTCKFCCFLFDLTSQSQRCYEKNNKKKNDRNERTNALLNELIIMQFCGYLFQVLTSFFYLKKMWIVGVSIGLTKNLTVGCKKWKKKKKKKNRNKNKTKQKTNKQTNKTKEQQHHHQQQNN